MFSIGMGELFIVFLVALIVFGPERLPDLARSAGRALARFNQTFDGIQRELNEGMQEVKKAAEIAPSRNAKEGSENAEPKAQSKDRGDSQAEA